MSEYKRLTNKNIDEFNPEYDFCIGCEYFGEPNGCNRQSGSCGNYDQFNEMYNHLAELEDKIENGTLVELPCKVGDRVYQTDGIRIYESTIKNIIYDTDSGLAFDDRAIGNSVFLTREEAEKALAERRKKMNKEAFKFDEYKPWLDWHTTEHHIINCDDYNYFKLDRRFGPSWWLYGMKLIENPYHWEEKEIGQIYESDLRRFIEWAKTDHGSRIINIHMICGNFDIFKEVGKLIDNQLVKENEKLKALNDRALRGLRGICKECKKYETCGSRKGSHMYCWEWKYSEKDGE